MLVSCDDGGEGRVLPRDERGLLRSEDSGVAVHAPERTEGVRPRERFSALPALACAAVCSDQCDSVVCVYRVCAGVRL